jgi:predicted metal-binding membrane protein
MASIAQQRSPVPARLHVGVLVSLLALTALAWLLTHERMIGMDAGPGTDLGGLGFYVVSWVVMMGAMMFPSIAPMVMAFGFVQRRRRNRGAVDRIVSSWVFVAGYLLTWSAFGLLAYGLYVGVRSLSIPELSWHRGGPYLAGGVLLAAAVYQLTPVKDACLRRCRAPLDFVLTNWREGPSGALRMGAVHGAWCVGCCWGLMVSLFALGVMSVTWMVAIAGLIAVEKLLPRKELANRLVAVTLLVLAFGVALAPQHVPGLTLPDSQAAARAMGAMHGNGGAMSKHGMAPTMPNPGMAPPLPNHGMAPTMPKQGTAPTMPKHGMAPMKNSRSPGH